MTETLQDTVKAVEHKPFRYDIRNPEVATILTTHRFIVYHPAPTYTIMEAPPDLSTTRARKAISTAISLYKAKKGMERAQLHYEQLFQQMSDVATASSGITVENQTGLI
jgi:hypothetical protein